MMKIKNALWKNLLAKILLFQDTHHVYFVLNLINKAILLTILLLKDPNVILSGGWDCRVIIWDVRGGIESKNLII